MELRHLRYFVTIAETENLHRAAERLSVAPSALSRQIRNLESDLGVELFERNSGRLQLSSVGRELLQDAKQLIADSENTRERARRIARGQIGSLRLSFQGTACRHRVVPECCHVFRRQYPEADLVITSMWNAAQASAIVNGDLDGAFSYRHDEVLELASLHIHTGNWLLAMARHHALATRPRLYLRDLENEAFIWGPRTISPSLHHRMMAECRAGGLEPRIIQEAVDETIAFNLVSVGMGVCFALAEVSRYWPDDVVFKIVEDFSVPMYLRFNWSQGNKSPLLHNFIDIVRGQIPTRPSGVLKNHHLT
jgi:DNA-binding transcriptional LysR family regulator